MSRNLGKSVEKEAVISDEAIHSFRRILGAKKQEKESVEKEEIAEEQQSAASLPLKSFWKREVQAEGKEEKTPEVEKKEEAKGAELQLKTIAKEKPEKTEEPAVRKAGQKCREREKRQRVAEDPDPAFSVYSQHVSRTDDPCHWRHDDQQL